MGGVLASRTLGNAAKNGIEGAGSSIGYGIRDAAGTLRVATNEASLRTAEAMLNSTRLLSDTALKATDLASKRLSLTLLEGVALTTGMLTLLQSQ